MRTNFLLVYAWCVVATVVGIVCRAASPPNRESLKNVYADCFRIGVAIPHTDLTKAEYQLLLRHFNAITPENCMKPQPIQPAEGVFCFHEADALVEMAIANGLEVNGHTLIWHQQCPKWFFIDGDRLAGRERVLARMRTHIKTVVGHFAGRVKSWDVVNEALCDGLGYLKKTPWLTTIGKDFIAEAFIAASKADPKAKLYYNDYGIERPWKRIKALRLIRDLKRHGAPIHGIGIQGHWQLDRIPFKDIERAIIAFHQEGLEVAITELDIDVVGRNIFEELGLWRRVWHDPFANGLPAQVQTRLADQYSRLFALFLKHRDKITRVTFWGLHDGRSWLNYWPHKRTNHPLLWDRALQPKPALLAVLAIAHQKK